MYESPVPGVDGGNALRQKMTEATRCTIIILYILLNIMLDQLDLNRSLTVQMKRSISGRCFFLDAQFRFMPRVVIYLRSCSYSQSVCICVILKPLNMHNLCTCGISSTTFSIFRFLIILTIANMMFRDMVLRKPIPLICMREQHILTSLYLSRMVW